MSKRLLELLTYLARHHVHVAHLMLLFPLPSQEEEDASRRDQQLPPAAGAGAAVGSGAGAGAQGQEVDRKGKRKIDEVMDDVSEPAGEGLQSAQQASGAGAASQASNTGALQASGSSRALERPSGEAGAGEEGRSGDADAEMEAAGTECVVEADGRMILRQVHGERWEVALLLLLRLLSRPVYARSTAHLEQVSPTPQSPPRRFSLSLLALTE